MAPRGKGRATTFRSWPQRVLAAGALAIGLAASSVPATAADGAPQITDTAGDANFVNGQGVVAGYENGNETAAASLGNADLLQVWFSTAYDVNQVRDVESGDVVRVEHIPTALQIHLRTSAPVYPTSPPNRTVRYRVLATLPDCRASFEVSANGSDPSTAWAAMVAVTAGCGNIPAGQGANTSVRPAFDGAVATVTFPFTQSLAYALWPGAAITAPRATVDARAHISFPQPILDEAATGADFVIGEDVPPDIDCIATPHPDCQQ